MKNVLICSIVRNQEKNLQRWYNQILQLVKYCPDCTFHLSIYENDSQDNTKEILKNYDYWFIGGEKIITTSNLGTNQYGSVWSEDRLANLAFYRNSCINQIDIIKNNIDLIIFIEPDVKYDAKWAQELINQKICQPDIYSAWSLRSEAIPKESMYLYDTSSTRATENDLYWDFDTSEKKCQLINSDWAIFSCWTTFNCLCVYNAKPFKEGIRFGHINERLKERGGIQPYRNYIDSDTVVICENFRKAGYNKIYFNRNVIVRHL